MTNRHRGNAVPGARAGPAGQCPGRSLDGSPSGLHVRSAATWTPPPKDNAVALTHQLSERLTAATNYLRGLKRLAEGVARPEAAPTLETLAKALGQLDEAGLLIRRIRSATNAADPASNGAGSRHNTGAGRRDHGEQPMGLPHHTVEDRSATPRMTIVPAPHDFSSKPSKIRDWHTHVLMVAYGLLENESATMPELPDGGTG